MLLVDKKFVHSKESCSQVLFDAGYFSEMKVCLLSQEPQEILIKHAMHAGGRKP